MKTSVLLIHQGISLQFLEAFSLDITAEYVLVTTHEFLPSETSRLSTFKRPPLTIIKDRDLIQEADFERIDAEVCAEFVKPREPLATPQDVSNSILNHRAALIRERLLNQFGVELKFFHADGLGIPSKWWQDHGSTALLSPDSDTKIAPRRSLLNSVRQRFTKSGSWNQLITPSGKPIVLSGRLARISCRIQPHFKVRPATILQRIRFAFPTRVFERVGTYRFASPVHDYAPFKYRPTLVLQDGHLPRDYSKSALYCYPSSERLVPSNPFSEAWIRTSGFEPYNLPGFSDPDFGVPTQNATSCRNVLLALGHGGDWSPFIHRSDTDRMVIEFIQLAARNPDLQFRIRPHPTMVHPSHEGPGSLERITKEIEISGLQNLSNSTSGLQDDLDWAGVVISEYSQVLLDAWRLGRIGIIFNPTGRRSFLREYEELGFPSTTSSYELAMMIRQPEKLLEQQTLASGRYNSTMEAWRKRTLL
ncbi:MAG: hypothetical protein RL173_174 [Fibrobacterota bacterium]|jgi:hypothetical protein